MADKSGILKHAASDLPDDSSEAKKLRWDEDNLLITEATRGGKMKVTEPKTPFVHYDPATDRSWVKNGEIPALDLSNELEELELDASHPSLGEPSSVEPAAALETPGSTFPEQSGDGASDVLEKDPDSPEDPWEAEEREEEEELTQEQLAHKKDFEKHRSDFYRIDRSILSAPVDDEEDEEDGEGNEAQTSREAEDQNMEEEEEQEEDQEGEDDEDGFSENKAAEDSDDDD